MLIVGACPLMVGIFKFNDMQKEIWKDIPGYESLYQASSFGMVKSFKRNKKGIMLSLYVDNRGYRCVRLLANNKSKHFQVHQIIAISFLNHKPDGHITVVDHIDYNKLNNHIDNLQLISQRENCSKDRFRKNYSSKHVGVSWQKDAKKWRSIIMINGKSKHLGFFISESKASFIYKKALENIKHHNGNDNDFRKLIGLHEINYTSKYVGVNWNAVKNKWIAQIQINGKKKHIGNFNDEIKAHEAYQKIKCLA